MKNKNFHISYGGTSRNGDIYTPYKAVVHTADEAINVINTWQTYGRKNSGSNIKVNPRTEDKIRNIFCNGLGTYPNGQPRTVDTMRTTGCGAWDIYIRYALAGTIEEHERIYRERASAADAERSRQTDHDERHRLAELSEVHRGWYNVQLDLRVMVFNTHGNDYFKDMTFTGKIIADSGIDAYNKTVKYIQDHPEELTHNGNMATLQTWSEAASDGFSYTFLGIKTDDGYKII